MTQIIETLPCTMIEDDKLTNLINLLKDMNGLLLAFSGGVDSTFLLKVIQIAGIKSLAVTASSEVIPAHEMANAEEIAKEFRVDHRVLKVDLLTEEFSSNSPERCFLCKTVLFRKLAQIALEEGCGFLIDGSNRDDLMDFRPGQKAASEYRVRSPLIEAGFSKSEVREFSRRLGLPTWNKPSSSCLATRIPYGRKITRQTLERIERSEDLLRSLGFHQIRVRDHGDIARIEIGEDEMDLIFTSEKRKIISDALKSFGYRFISLDLGGYRVGSMNHILGNT